MLRVLHVVNGIDINDGVMSVLMNYYRTINRSKIQFDFLYFDESSSYYKNEINELGGKTFLIKSGLKSINVLKELKSFFSSHKNEYPIVHCHPIWGSVLISLTIRGCGVEHVIQHSHSTKYSDKKLSAIRNRFLIIAVNRFATDFMACSPEAASLFKTNNRNVFILNNAIFINNYCYDDQLRQSTRNEFDAPTDSLVFGSVGRLCVQKNQLFLISIFKEIVLLEPKAKLVLVGSGPLQEEIEKRIEEFDLEDNVIMLGRRSDIKALLSSFDMFLMPSLFEGSPVAAIEALSSGLPCLISDTITSSINSRLTDYYSLNKTSKEWAREALSFFEKHRNDNRQLLDKSILNNFDINKESIKLYDYYSSLSR